MPTRSIPTADLGSARHRRDLISRFGAGLLALSSLGIFTNANAQILRYDFNEGTGTAVDNSGSAGSAGDLTLGGVAGWAAGVEGSAYHAVPFTPNSNTYATAAATLSALDNLSAFTITGWLNPTVFSDFFPVLNWIDGGAGVRLRLLDAGELELSIGPSWTGSIFASSTSGEFGAVDGWLFFAVSWDGTGGETDKVNFYLGTEGDSASLVSTMDRAGATTTGTSSTTFMIGQTSTVPEEWWNAYQGSIDDIRVYGSVLDTSAIQGVRAEAIPEPSSVAFLLLSAGALICARRRSQRVG